LTARCRLRETRRFARGEHGGRGERRCFFGWRRLRRIEPSGTSLGGRTRDAEAALCRTRELVPTGARQCDRLSRARGAFHPRKTARASFESSRGALPRWPAMAAAARVHRCSRTSTRPLAARSHARARGRVRSSGFCRAMFPRARPWTARTPPSRSCDGSDCLAGPSRPDPWQSPKGLRSGAEENRSLVRSPRRLLATETSPRPRPFRAPPVATAARSPCPE
jgi:hypothetical protein